MGLIARGKKILNKKIEPQIIIWGIVFLIFYFHIRYLIRTTYNVPIMDYWRYIHNVVHKIEIGKFGFLDCFESYAGHKNSINIFLLFLNIKFFDYNTLIEIYGGAVIRFILFIIAVIQIKKIWVKESNIIQYISILFVGLFIFNLNQWEIISIEFSLAFAIRILCFWLIFTYVDYKICNNKKLSNDLIVFGVLFITCVVNIAGAYFAAMIVAFGIPIVIKLFLTPVREDKKRVFVLGVIFLVISLSATILYFSGMQGVSESGANIDILKIFQGAVVMLASSIIHTNVLSTMNTNLIIIIGILILCVYIIFIFFYIRDKSFEKTSFPIMLILYAIISCIVISYGRSGNYNVEYLESSRYVIESTLGNIGFIIGVAIYFKNNKISTLMGIFAACLTILICVAGIEEYRMGVFRKVYSQNLAYMMDNIDEYSDEELNSFQANSPEQVRESVKMMEEYNLGIFGQ